MFNRRHDSHTDACSSRSLASPFSFALALAGTAAALVLTGCGFGAANTSASPFVTPSIAGKAMGGPNPIVGATVKIYATGNSSGQSTGYGVGSALQEATQQGASAGQDTDSGGGFSFPGGYNCPAGQFAYLVVSGGNTGGNAVNNNAVLVAALGRCEDLYNNVAGTYTGYKGSNIYVNEITTIAAAYALGHFSSVTGSGTGGSTVVSIGSTATNNAAQVSGVSTGCVYNGTTCTTTATAGLAHAFQNAANLVNVFSNGGLFAGANTNLPGNSAAVVPQALINSIGNILVSCVNSTGGVAGDGTTVCGSIFSATTIGANVPADTFSAMVNLAANPTLGGSVTAVGNFFNLSVPASSVYQPALASNTGLDDFSIAINYPSGLGAAPTTPTASCATTPCQGLAYPISGALDINDVYYLGNQVSSGGAAGLNLFAFASNGTLLSQTTNGATLKFTLGLSVDALGNGYFGNGSGSGTSALGVFSTGGGTLSQYSIKTVGGAKVYNTAVDRSNNVWVLGTATSAPTLLSSASGGGSFTGQATFTVAVPSSPGNIGLAIDPNQNVWTANTATIGVLQNTGTALAPTYSSSSTLTTTAGGGSVVGIAFTPGNAYVSSYSTGPGIQPFAPTYTGAEVTALGAGTLTTVSSKITGSIFNEADGAGTIWIADTNSHSVIAFTPNSTPASDTAYRLEPCAYQSATQGCFTGTNTQASLFTTGKPYEIGIDSAGSIWAPGPAGGNVVQIIGAAAPTWPLLSLGKSGTP